MRTPHVKTVEIPILLTVISIYGVVLATGCRGRGTTSWPDCSDACAQATLDVRIADPSGGKGPLKLEPTSAFQGCPLTVKWASCYDETTYDPSALKCTPKTFPLTFTGTKERVMI